MKRSARHFISFLGLLGLSTTLCPLMVAAADVHPLQPVQTLTPDGQVVCNAGGAFSQISGHPDLFVGRGIGIGTLDYCHNGAQKAQSFLGIFQLSDDKTKFVLQNIILQSPLKMPGGVSITGSIDPFVASYRGENWVAFECNVSNGGGACVAPLTPDLKRLDMSRFSVAAKSLIGPLETTGQIVCLQSASSPVLLNYKDRLYLYWIIDFFENANPENKLISRGMQLEGDARGRLWGAGSEGKPVMTNDDRLTSLVEDVNENDKTADHLAGITYATTINDKIVVISSIGGTAGQQVCKSTHDKSPGCWRPVMAVADNPLGYNVFGGSHVSSPFPSNIIEYPRLFRDKHSYILYGAFQQLVGSPYPGYSPPINSNGVHLLNFGGIEAPAN